MLLYSIKAKASIVESVRSYFGGRKVETGKCEWGKLQYSTWMDEKVIKIFKVGDLVALASSPPIPNMVPYHMEITYLSELYWDVMYDKDKQEPKPITCRSLRGTFESFGPSTIRLLTDEEKALVNLSNQKHAGTA